MNKDSPDTTVGLDKEFSKKVEKQNRKALTENQKKLEVDLKLFLDSVDRVASVSVDKKDGVKFLAYRCKLNDKEIRIEKKIDIINE